MASRIVRKVKQSRKKNIAPCPREEELHGSFTPFVITPVGFPSVRVPNIIGGGLSCSPIAGVHLQTCLTASPPVRGEQSPYYCTQPGPEFRTRRFSTNATAANLVGEVNANVNAFFEKALSTPRDGVTADSPELFRRSVRPAPPPYNAATNRGTIIEAFVYLKKSSSYVFKHVVCCFVVITK